jgi:hypothetical protein
MIKIDSMPRSLLCSDYNWRTPLDEHLRSIGYSSCQFVSDFSMNSGYWEFSDSDYMMFALTWV